MDHERRKTRVCHQARLPTHKTTKIARVSSDVVAQSCVCLKIAVACNLQSRTQDIEMIHCCKLKQVNMAR